jgi:hypothetical protein
VEEADDGGEAKAGGEGTEERSSDYSSDSDEDDDAPAIDASVYAFVPPSTATPSAATSTTGRRPPSAALATSVVGTAPRPAPAPRSLHEQSLLVVAERSARGGDELDGLLSLHDNTKVLRPSMAGPGGQAAGARQAPGDLKALESDLDALLNGA